jgi:DNA-binding response OmpR family regulator
MKENLVMPVMNFESNIKFDPQTGFKEKMVHKVLIVDDDPDFQSLLKEVLDDDHLYVGQSLSLGQAFFKILTEHYDMVILDVKFPKGGNGVNFLNSIRRYGFFRNLPVILVSSDSEESLGEKAKNLRIAYETKPINPKQFSKRIHSIIGQYAK